MRYLFVVLTLAACLAAFTSTRADDEPAGAKKPLRSYTITVVEFHLKNGEDLSLSAATIAQDFEKLSKRGDVSLVETVRLTAIEGYQASAMFGKMVAIVQGVTTGVNGKSRNMVQRSLGTTLKVTAQSQDEKVLLKLNYQTTRMDGEAKKDAAQDMSTVAIDTNLLLKLDGRVVVAGTTESASTFLLVTVTQ